MSALMTNEAVRAAATVIAEKLGRGRSGYPTVWMLEAHKAFLGHHATAGRKELDKEARARAHDAASTFGNYEMALVDAVADAVVSTLVDP